MNAPRDLPSLQLAAQRLVEARDSISEVHQALKFAREEFEAAEEAVLQLLCSETTRGDVIVCGSHAVVCATDDDPWELPAGLRVRIHPLATMVDATPPEPCIVDAAGTYIGDCNE